MAEITIQVAQAGDSTSEAGIRSHRVLIDRPEAKGGADRGPMGGELLLAGLGGCFMSNLLAAIKAREVQASDLQVEVTGTLEESPPRFSAMSLRLSGDYADRAEIERLASMAEKACISANTLREGVRLTLSVE